MMSRVVYPVSIRGLTKSYGNFHCLRGCDLEVPSDGVFGLLGPNGAGKSTLLRTLLGFLSITSGEASVCGYDVRRESLQVRRSTAYLPGDPRLYRTMTGKRLLRMFSNLHPSSTLKGCLRVADKLDLDLSRMVMFMSTGMRQKLALSVVLGCEAPLVMLDEPTANLDPNVRQTVLELIREVRDSGRTVMLSSHIFSDIDETCNRVAILRDGKIVTTQTMDSISHSYIVVARCNATESATPKLLRQAPQLENWHFRAPAFENGELELHFSGEPSAWLPWLGEQDLQVGRIEKAGVQALYQQYHSRSAGVATSDGKAL
ncbi:MAG: ATP-binding cassette domain-containing protein [Planctomycetota bacterium]|nr:ATP-binding cassette domain-containing protein [Planctomycetota bacterium]